MIASTTIQPRIFASFCDGNCICHFRGHAKSQCLLEFPRGCWFTIFTVANALGMTCVNVIATQTIVFATNNRITFGITVVKIDCLPAPSSFVTPYFGCVRWQDSETQERFTVSLLLLERFTEHKKRKKRRSHVEMARASWASNFIQTYWHLIRTRESSDSRRFLLFFRYVSLSLNFSLALSLSLSVFFSIPIYLYFISASYFNCFFTFSLCFYCNLLFCCFSATLSHPFCSLARPLALLSCPRSLSLYISPIYLFSFLLLFLLNCLLFSICSKLPWFKHMWSCLSTSVIQHIYTLKHLKLYMVFPLSLYWAHTCTIIYSIYIYIYKCM